MAIRTLHLTNAWHAASGGIATFYKELINGAARHRRELRLVVPGDEDALEEPNPFVRVYRLRAPRAILNPAYRLVLPHRYVFPNTAIRRILKAEQPQLIEACDKYAFLYLAGLIRRNWLEELDQRPVTVALSCERMDENMAHYLSKSVAARLFTRWYMKWIYFGQFDHHIAVSDHTAGELRIAARGHIVRRGVWVEPMGVDVDGFSPSLRDTDLREQLLRKAGGDASSILLFYAGRLAPEKNLKLLAQALGALTSQGVDARLIIAGEGISKSALERELSECAPGRFHFAGHIGSRVELSRLYASADAFVHPNPREPFGLAPLEAMASGLALVAPNQGGVTTYCTSENSWPAEPEAEAFAKAIRAAATDSEERRDRVANALETVKAYAWNSVIDRYFDLYDEIFAMFRNLPLRGIEPSFYSTPGNWLGVEEEPAEIYEPSNSARRS